MDFQQFITPAPESQYQSLLEPSAAMAAQAVTDVGSSFADSQDQGAKASLLSEGEEVAAVASAEEDVTVPPSFWMWKTTAAPPTPPNPGPNPNLVWQVDTWSVMTPFPTTPPIWENCYGCDCLLVYETDVVAGGAVPDKYTCFNPGGPSSHVPAFKWAGTPEPEARNDNWGGSHRIRSADGNECIKSRSFAITAQDLDYPYGAGEQGNSVRDVFWAANIPGDWTEFNDNLAHATYRDLPQVVVGRNRKGELGMETPCPEKGVHRYAFTLWALKDYIGTEGSPLSPDTPFADMIGLIEEKELARYMFYGTVSGRGLQPGSHSFLQKVQSGFKAWF